MASKQLDTRIIIANDTAENWVNANPTPLKGEIFLEIDTGKYKIGNGIDNYALLPYYNHIDDGVKNSIDTLIEMLTEDKFGKVDDVQVNGTTVITNKVANITIANITYSDEAQAVRDDSLTNTQVILHKISKTGSYADLIGTPTVVDNLDSVSTTDVLSANQGNELKKMVQAIPKAYSFETTSDMVTQLNQATADKYVVGTNLFIASLNVPDYWIYATNENPVEYTFTTAQALVDEIRANKSVQIGYYSISLLETEKVDLTNYVTKDDLKTAVDNLHTEIGTLQDLVNNNIDDVASLLTRVDAIEKDTTIVRTTDNLILNGGNSQSIS